MATFKRPIPRVPEERCELTDMITYSCPCAKHRDIKPDAPTAGLVIEMFIEGARYDGVCAVNDEHTIKVGDRIARVAEDGNPPKVLGYCCTTCRIDIEHYWETLP